MNSKLILIFATLLFVASAPGIAPEEAPSRIPSRLLEDLCTWLVTQHGLDTRVEIAIREETMPIIDIFLLHLLTANDELTPADANRDDHLSENLRKSFKPIRVMVPEPYSLCVWKVWDDRTSTPGVSPVFTFSSPLKNPYASDSAQALDVFARITGGALGGDWYWVVLERLDTEWRAGEIFSLDISEN